VVKSASFSRKRNCRQLSEYVGTCQGMLFFAHMVVLLVDRDVALLCLFQLHREAAGDQPQGKAAASRKGEAQKSKRRKKMDPSQLTPAEIERRKIQKELRVSKLNLHLLQLSNNQQAINVLGDCLLSQSRGSLDHGLGHK